MPQRQFEDTRRKRLLMAAGLQWRKIAITRKSFTGAPLMPIDLNNLSRAELQKLSKDVDKALASLADREKKAALKAAELAAAEHGYSLSELTSGAAPKAKKTGSKSPAKYRNPSDASMTWTGKGRRPAWIREAQENGVDISKFEI
ncbi:H-NS family nucleoid-associated regulatory protein [Pseudoroseicyclus sp. CXY001]|uniref:H-NS histone family protein n=1 Tax=Pseudoroseicyclus sp. CXY001 TaxID=3242492 RepID=UPI00358DA69E